jgi:hypothetical protein
MMLQGYVKQVLSFHTDGGLPCPSLADINYIKMMTHAVKKYETVPKRKQVIFDSMFHYIAKLAAHASEDSLVCTVVDWIALSCYTGFQKLEWCSKHHDSFTTIDDPNWGNHPTVLPIIVSDFHFATDSGCCIHDLASSLDKSIVATSLCFHKPINNDMAKHSRTAIAPIPAGCVPHKHA